MTPSTYDTIRKHHGQPTLGVSVSSQQCRVQPGRPRLSDDRSLRLRRARASLLSFPGPMPRRRPIRGQTRCRHRSRSYAPHRTPRKLTGDRLGDNGRQSTDTVSQLNRQRSFQRTRKGDDPIALRADVWLYGARTASCQAAELPGISQASPEFRDRHRACRRTG